MSAAIFDTLDHVDGVFTDCTVATNGRHRDWRYGVDTSQYEYAAHCETRNP
jgi:hypothetical protein